MISVSSDKERWTDIYAKVNVSDASQTYTIIRPIFLLINLKLQLYWEILINIVPC